MTDDTISHSIVGLGAQGDGVTQAGGFVAGALPGETVDVRADGRIEVVGAASPGRRVVPLCPHLPACGGCAVQHMSDGLYREWKRGLLTAALAHRGIDEVGEPLLQVPLRSRRRAVLAGVEADGAIRLGFHGAGSHAVEPIEACAVLRPEIVAALPALGRLAEHVLPRGTRVRLSVLAAENGLDIRLEGRATARSQRAASATASLMRAARAIRLTVGDETLLSLGTPTVRIADVAVAPPPGAFLQAAAEAETMLAALVQSGIGKARRVADLFCGLGTLTLPLARHAQVLAVDGDPALLEALGQAVAGAQGLKPVERLRRDLFRDPLSPRELDVLDAVVLDPPRAGAQAQAMALARSKVRTVVMVSCNPATLGRDLRILVDGGYAVERAVPVDQFLFSPHLEAVVLLSRPSSKGAGRKGAHRAA